MAKSRLDALLVDRGLFENRSRAAAAVIAGDVRLGDNGRRADKPGQMVAPDVSLAVAEGPQYVSRGGISWRTRSTRSGSTPPAAARSTSAHRPAGSPIACCSAEPCG